MVSAGTIGLILTVQLICEESWTDGRRAGGHDGMTARQTHGKLIAMLRGPKSEKQKPGFHHRILYIIYVHGGTFKEKPVQGFRQ